MSRMWAATRSVGEHRPLDQRRPRAAAQAERLGDVPGRPRLLDLEIADGQPLALSARQRRVGLEHLEALAERGAERDPADERAASLPADDLAVALEALERQPQGSPRDAEPLGQLLLGRQTVARAGTTRREPLAKRGLGRVDHRGPGHGRA